MGKDLNAIIREVMDSDVEGILRIYAKSVETENSSWEYEAPDLEEMGRRVKGCLDSGYPYLVAEAEGVVAGYAYASAFRTRIGYRFTVENSVYVSRDFKRRGIATALMVRLIEACTAKGYRQMIGMISSPGNEASVELHRKLGFVHEGQIRGVGWKRGEWLDVTVMRLELGEGTRTPPPGGE